jgi:hypothetical protein
MKDMATFSLSKPNQIFSQVVATLNNDTRAVLPNLDTIKRTLRNHRRLNFPPDPTSLDDLVVDGSWAETAGDNPDDFLLYDNGPHAQNRMLIFSRQCLEKLSSAETWLMDGNFSMAPPPFQQLYVIRVPLGETAQANKHTRNCFGCY